MIRMDYIMPSMRIVAFKDMVDPDVMEERMSQFIALEEDRFIVGFHKQVQKEREKAWHDKYIKEKKFQVRYLIPLYENKILKFPRKFKMHWLGPDINKHITDGGVVQLEKLNGELVQARINSSRLKMYRDNTPPPRASV